VCGGGGREGKHNLTETRPSLLPRDRLIRLHRARGSGKSSLFRVSERHIYGGKAPAQRPYVSRWFVGTARQFLWFRLDKPTTFRIHRTYVAPAISIGPEESASRKNPRSTVSQRAPRSTNSCVCFLRRAYWHHPAHARTGRSAHFKTRQSAPQKSDASCRLKGTWATAFPLFFHRCVAPGSALGAKASTTRCSTGLGGAREYTRARRVRRGIVDITAKGAASSRPLRTAHTIEVVSRTG